MKDNKYYKKTKFFISLVKEKLWLEEMARKGYLLTNMKYGINYTFRISEPKHMLYEVDRFNLPKSPSLKEIHQKEEFLSLATEMGWEVITHDEDMNYYFAKEYLEGDINELYNDDEMRLVRANKYKNHYFNQSSMFDKMAFGFGFLFLVFGITNHGFMSLGLAYVLFLLGMNILIRSIANLMYDELRVTSEEWKRLHSKDMNTRTVHKWFLFTKGLNKYLSKQREKGWKVSSISSSKYVFKKSEPGSASYVIDTKSSVNKRMKAKNLQGFNNKKDTLIQNNDWQVQSVKDADEIGLDFIGASGNNIVIYENSNGTGELDYTKNACTSPLILSFATYVLLGAVIGFVVGFAGVMLRL